jgi:hypothetical protein
MFSLDPQFILLKCDTLPVAFGGVQYSLEELSKPYSVPKLKDEVKEVVSSAGRSLENAYGVKAVVESPEPNVLSAKISPIEAKFENKAVFFDIDMYRKMPNVRRRNSTFFQEIGNICKKMFYQGKENATIGRPDGNGFYFFHALKERFDPESAGYLLEAMETLMLRATSNEFMTRREIGPDCLKVDLKLGRPKNMGYLV